MTTRRRAAKNRSLLVRHANPQSKSYMAAVLVALFVGVGYLVVHYSSAASCSLNSILENPCRPLIGAAANGNPGAPKGLISQFDYLEKLVGQTMDVDRDYHTVLGTPNNSDATLPLDPSTVAGQAEKAQIDNGTLMDLNWDVTRDWSVVNSSNTTVTAQIDQTAANIKTVAPHKIFLSPWHEANLHVGAPDPGSGEACAPNTTDGMGTPSQFVSAWQYIYNRFKADGVTNVVWVLNFGSYAPRDCWVNYMWPGNADVDWVIVDSYSAFNHLNWDQSAGNFYTNVLQADSTPTHNIDSKPWGLGEFGDCNAPTPSQAYSYFNSITAAVKANSYPNYKMYLIYADTGNSAGPGCLTNYDPSSASAPNGTLDNQKQTDVNAMFAAIVGQAGNSPTPTPPPSTSPTPPITPSPSTPPSPPTSTSPNPGSGSGSGSGSSGGTGTVTLASPGSPATITVNGQVVSHNGTLNTSYLTNGNHTVTVTQNGKTTSKVVSVHNKLNPFDTLRNFLFSGFVAHPLVMDVGTIIVLIIPLGLLAFELKKLLAKKLGGLGGVRTNLS